MTSLLSPLLLSKDLEPLPVLPFKFIRPRRFLDPVELPNESSDPVNKPSSTINSAAQMVSGADQLTPTAVRQPEIFGNPDGFTDAHTLSARSSSHPSSETTQRASSTSYQSISMNDALLLLAYQHLQLSPPLQSPSTFPHSALDNSDLLSSYINTYVSVGRFPGTRNT